MAKPEDDGFVADEDGFVPDSGAAPTPVAPSIPARAPTSMGESFARGIGQGGTFGFGDEFSGLAGAATELAGRLPWNKEYAEYGDEGPIDAMAKRYRLERDAMRSEDENAHKSNAKTYFTGQLAGGLAVPVGGAAKAGASLATRMALGAKLAGGLGALSGLGNSEADLTKGEVPRALLDTGVGGVVGAGIGAAVPAVAQGISNKLGPYLRKYAETQAFKSLTGGGGIANKAQREGLDAIGDILGDAAAPIEGEVMKTPNQLGRFALDRGAVKLSPEEMVRTLRLQLAGEKGLQADALKAASAGGSFDLAKAAAQQRAASTGLNEVEQLAAGPREAAVAALERQAAKSPQMSFEAANALKTSLNGGFKPGLENKPAQASLNEAIALYRKAILDQAEQAAGPDVANALRSANNNQANLILANKLAGDRVTRDAANQSLGIKDMLTSGAGAALGGMFGPGGAGLGSIALPVLSKALRPYLPAISARGADAAASGLEGVARSGLPTLAASRGAPSFIEFLRKKREEAQ
jgi:hypothetical protein